ncbi:hypothetical protein QQF45_05525 [Halopseudomonas aestusnigri]|uniref:hypothetical protein n=1 Tax=Halopseudomonas aestusnigri TaxID=857252 RepID=UPI0025543B14|nr:hypothetical protein [Halopseudomonas aestusnigri]MDL2198523.1 hypothetical protein [Halopseudomonas aestusnigri]
MAPELVSVTPLISPGLDAAILTPVPVALIEPLTSTVTESLSESIRHVPVTAVVTGDVAQEPLAAPADSDQEAARIDEASMESRKAAEGAKTDRALENSMTFP